MLREAGIAPWARPGLPLVYCDDLLAAVPGIGVDPRLAPDPGDDAVELVWNAR
jgi:tRNA(Ile)-lysidine synthase